MKEVLGIVVGGGPAPGINGVISAATIEAANKGLKVIGIMGGFKSLFAGDRGAVVPLGIDDVARIHNRGGSILKTSRDYPERAQEAFSTLMKTLRALRVRYLLTIGGDGTLFMARWIEQKAKGAISVIHVPKTIDNDIPLPGGMPTFGYETARHWGVELVENIMEDASTTGRWYFISTMGRSTGHLALGIGKAAGASVTLIPEEFAGQISLKRIADVLEGSIIKRLAMGKRHGVAVMAEGIANMFDPRELESHEHLDRDETGRLRLSEIDLGGLMKEIVRKSLGERGIDLTIIEKRIGYELRAADPIPFDAEYTRNLGYGAVRFLLLGGTGSMVAVYEGRLKAVPFVELSDHETGKTILRHVDTSSEIYHVAQEYMFKLTERDLEGETLGLMARAARMPEEAFRARFLPVAVPSRRT